jgi:C4-type Zn-finger protein
MQCPQCKTHDVYISRSAKPHVLNFLMVTVRCHRCCYLFSVPRWSSVTDKPPSTETEHKPVSQKRRAA